MRSPLPPRSGIGHSGLACVVCVPTAGMSPGMVTLGRTCSPPGFSHFFSATDSNRWCLRGCRRGTLSGIHAATRSRPDASPRSRYCYCRSAGDALGTHRRPTPQRRDPARACGAGRGQTGLPAHRARPPPWDGRRDRSGPVSGGFPASRATVAQRSVTASRPVRRQSVTGAVKPESRMAGRRQAHLPRRGRAHVRRVRRNVKLRTDVPLTATGSSLVAETELLYSAALRRGGAAPDKGGAIAPHAQPSLF